MVLTWPIAAAVVISFNLLVDPMDISPIRIAIAGFNERKPLRQDYDRIVKRHDVWRNQPRTIFMGSSRVKQTIDPTLITTTGFAPAYNGAMNGSAEYGEIGSYLRYYIQVDKNLRHVFIEAFATSLLATGTGPMTEFSRADDIADFASVFFTIDGLSSAVRTVWLNGRNRTVGSFSDDGFAPVVLAPHHFSVRNVFNFVFHRAYMNSNHRLDPGIIVAARAIVADCKSRGVECSFFISPLHADVLYALYHLGLWGELEKLKRALAELAPTYDFTRYNDLIEERIGPVVYWPEAFHFSPALGELMAKAMTGSRTADMPENFGPMLDASNIDSSLAAWRKERDDWISQHPEAVERMRKAEDNFRNGLSFEAVTAAEYWKSPSRYDRSHRYRNRAVCTFGASWPRVAGG
jgi:hypothetical protein